MLGDPEDVGEWRFVEDPVGAGELRRLLALEGDGFVSAGFGVVVAQIGAGFRIAPTQQTP